jgi:hypothetical protein
VKSSLFITVIVSINFSEVTPSYISSVKVAGAEALPLTARQYGEVVLPDDSTGQSPGTLAGKLSRCKEGMARVFAVMVQILLNITRVAVQV